MDENIKKDVPLITVGEKDTLAIVKEGEIMTEELLIEFSKNNSYVYYDEKTKTLYQKV